MSEREHKSTMVELVAELEKLPQSPELAEIVAEAKAGEYHDYKNRKYDCGKVAVVGKLHKVASLPQTPKAVRVKLLDLRQQVIAGDFDEQADEADKAMLREQTPKHLWPKFGLEITH